MAVEEGADLHVEAIVLDDDRRPWDGERLAALRSGLGGAGFSVDALPDAVAARREAAVEGSSGPYVLTLEPTGAWSWTVPFATLMEDPHDALPDAAAEVERAVRVLLEVAPPYYATTWWSTFATPVWVRADHPFAAEGAGAVNFLSKRYLDTHLGGEPLASPPARSLLVAGGQLLIVDDGWASNAKTRPLGDHLMFQQT